MAYMLYKVGIISVGYFFMVKYHNYDKINML